MWRAILVKGSDVKLYGYYTQDTPIRGRCEEAYTEDYCFYIETEVLRNIIYYVETGKIHFLYISGIHSLQDVKRFLSQAKTFLLTQYSNEKLLKQSEYVGVVTPAFASNSTVPTFTWENMSSYVNLRVLSSISGNPPTTLDTGSERNESSTRPRSSRISTTTARTES